MARLHEKNKNQKNLDTSHNSSLIYKDRGSNYIEDDTLSSTLPYFFI